MTARAEAAEQAQATAVQAQATAERNLESNIRLLQDARDREIQGPIISKTFGKNLSPLSLSHSRNMGNCPSQCKHTLMRTLKKILFLLTLYQNYHRRYQLCCRGSYRQ